MNKIIVVVLFCLVLSSINVSSQYGTYGITSARTMGLANTYTANSYGLFAVNLNPSLLAKERYEDKRFSLLFPNINVQAYSLESVLNLLETISTGRNWILDLDGEKIKTALDNGGEFYLDGTIGYFSAGFTPSDKIGSFAISFTDVLKTVIVLPKFAVDKINNADQKKFAVTLNDFKFFCAWFRAYSLAYARKVDLKQEGVENLYVGGSLKYYTGFLLEYIDISTSVELDAGDEFLFAAEYSATNLRAYSESIGSLNPEATTETGMPFPKPSGRGIGMDISASLEFTKGVIVGLSFTDIGNIKWKSNAKTTNVEGVIRIDSNITLDNIKSYFDSVAIVKESEESIKIQAPTTLRFGMAFQIDKWFNKFPGRMIAAVDLNQEITANMARDQFLRLSSSLEWKPGNHWPIFLTGISYDRFMDSRWSVGLGYEFKIAEIYLATADVVPYVEGSDRFSLSFTSVWYIR